MIRRLGPKPATAARSTFEPLALPPRPGTKAVAQLRRDLHLFMRGDEGIESQAALARRVEVLVDMYQVLHSLNEDLALVGGRSAARLVATLEAFTKELQAEPGDASSSAVRTFAQGIDLLAHLLEREPVGLEEGGPAPFVLVVDDEPLSRRLANLSLERAGLARISLDSSSEAIEILQRQNFDLILLDMHLPEMDGCELCCRLRKMPGHANTPVVFVTGRHDLKARAMASISGGTDFIGKPFHGGELAVKALCHILRARSPRPLGDTAIFTLGEMMPRGAAGTTVLSPGV